MTDEKETNHADARSHSNGGLATDETLKTDTDIGKQLLEIRKQYIANGGKLFTVDEINNEVRKNRGG